MENQKIYDQLISQYKAHFGKEPEVVAYAPGRIEVLGNHTDYNEGFVFSAAIDCGTFFAASKGEGETCRLVAGDVKKEVRWDVSKFAPAKKDTWQNYVMGTFAGLSKVKTITEGFDGMFLGNIPLGCGLSSSAALEMCTGLALAKLYGIQVDTVTMAKIGQKAEHEYAGCKCGLLDQISSLAGQPNMLVKTDFRSVTYETIPMGKNACFLMCNPHAHHKLVDGAYDTRRKACEDAAVYFSKVLNHPVKTLRDVSMAEWTLYKNGLDATIANRAAHPIGEDERVLLGAQLLDKGDLAGFGQLMFASHESSRVYFENSCKELDDVVDIAKNVPGVLGARLSGGGFGGSVVVLVHPRDAELAAGAISLVYKKLYDKPCEVSVIHPSAGAHLVK